MKNIFLAAFLVLGSAGCVSMSNPFVTAPVLMHPWDRVTPGMTHAMVSTIMDGHAIVGYEVDAATGAARPIEAQNLYSSEIVDIKGASYEIDSYIVHSPAAGERLNEAELFPVIYKEGLVVAKGKEGLASLRSEK